MIGNIETPNYINLGSFCTLVGSHQLIGFSFFFFLSHQAIAFVGHKGSGGTREICRGGIVSITHVYILFCSNTQSPVVSLG